jgi:DnaJ like chaperone protein
MSFSKWIGATIGWSFGGPIGAIIGLALGSVVDSISNGKKPTFTAQQHRSYKTRQYRSAQTQPGDFEVSLLILASFVIKADKRQDKRELDYVRQQFVTLYGKTRANNAFRLLRKLYNNATYPSNRFVYKYGA